MRNLFIAIGLLALTLGACEQGAGLEPRGEVQCVLNRDSLSREFKRHTQRADSLSRISPDSAIKEFRLAIEYDNCLAEDSLLAGILRLGIFQVSAKEISNARNTFQRGLDIVTKSDSARRSWAVMRKGDFLHGLANQYARLGRQDSAAYYAKLAIETKEGIYGKDSSIVGISVGALAQVLENQHRYKESDGLRHRALAIRRKQKKRNPTGLGIALYNLANNKVNLGQADSAAFYLQPAVAAFEEQPERFLLDYRYDCAKTQSEILLLQGDTLVALRAMDTFQREHLSKVPSKSNAVGALMLKRGELELMLRRTEAAESSFRSALLAYLPKEVDTIPDGLPPSFLLGRNPNVFRSLILIGKAQLAQDDTGAVARFVATFRLACQFYRRIQTQISPIDVPADLSGDAVAYFEYGIRQAAAHGRMDIAHEWLECSKDNEILDIMQDLERANIQPLSKRERDLIVAAQSKIDSIKRVDGPESTKILRLEQHLDSLIKSIEAKYPGRVFQPPTFASPTDIRAHLPNDSSLFISYYCGPQNLIIAGISPKGDTLMVVPIASGLGECMDQFMTMVHDLDADAQRFEAAAECLYAQILRPVFLALNGDRIPKRLIISPHGRLANIPFEALVTKKGKGKTSFAKLNYLLKSSVISYVQSGTIFTAYHADSLLQSGILGVGSTGQDRGLNELKFVDDELNAVVGHLGGTTMVDDIGSERLLKAQHVAHSGVHISSHGEYDTEIPLASRLFLPIDQEKEEDGVLHAFEVLKLAFPEKMAVLSACETGPGKPMQGQETVSMGYAFQVAGCSTVVMSLWKVEERNTAAIMDRFYAQLATKMPAASALTDARRHLLEENPQYAHPFYWAAWLMSGNGELVFAPGPKPFSWRWLAYGLGIALVCGVGLIWLRKRRQFQWV
jgi:CHAT domain-containing protein/tetratricopeptide (TPR) repeat protein